MRDMKFSARFYIITIYLLGAAFFIGNLIRWSFEEVVMLVILCIFASLALIIKVEGATNRSHYTFSFIVYGFAFASLGVTETAIVIIVSNLVEYLVKRKPAWYIQVFNTACYIIVINIAGLVFTTLNPSLSLTTPLGILSVTVSLVAFTFFNHLIVGIIVWLARGENFRESGIFDLLPLIIDMALLTFGAMLVLIWNYSPYALLVFIFPLYLIYKTMGVPALERKTETDSKTGLFNHAYFMQHLDNELKRANRFDRPLSVIMADLDLLRNINNTYGHLAGDVVLIEIAKILKQSVREYDVVARFGGEEFAILLPETTLGQAYERAELIRKTVENADFNISTSVTPIKATLSLGIANREDFAQLGQEIIHNADTALYHSKLKGRNRAYAYSQDAYVDFSGKKRESTINIPETIMPAMEMASTENEPVKVAQKQETRTQTPPSEPAREKPPTSNLQASHRNAKTNVNVFIGGLFLISLLLFASFYFIAPTLYMDLAVQSWLGIAGFAILLILTEWLSIDLYTKRTSLSTSAVPILAATLMFGPVASLIMSLVYAITTGIKHRSQFNRVIFNFSNQLIAGMIYTMLIYLTKRPFIELPTLMQLIFAVLSALIVYLINTSLISIGVHLDTKQSVTKFWKEQYSWLFLIYIGMGIVAATFVFGYKHDPFVGTLLVIVPLLLLRISQVQYVERTKNMVAELREKNATLEKYSDEITKLNDGLLDTLAEIIDLRDPYLFGHSQGVSELATKIAKRMGLHQKQVDLVRKGSLLHDIGKLGISPSILAKPARLTFDEYETIKKHPQIGASLLEKSPHLSQLIPIVRDHHEFYNGEGYPGQVAGNHIAIEARIVSVADAIEAMFSDRPYRKARSTEYIIQELQNCANQQFDPLATQAAIQILKEMESQEISGETVERNQAQFQESTIKM